MIFENVALREISEEHLQTLKLLRVAEEQQLEFKRELTLSRDAEKREFCKDLSAFANSVGGWLVFGVAENGSGYAADLVGFEPVPNEHDCEEQIRQIVASGVSPHLQGFDLKFVPLRNGRKALVIRVNNDGSLHQVRYNDNRFYKRVGNITMVMDPADIATFHRGPTARDRDDEIAEERHEFEADVKSGRFHGLRADDTGVLALAIIPRNPSAIPLFAKRQNLVTLFPPMYCSGWDMLYTQQSIVTFGVLPGKESPYSVTEVKGNGSVTAANSLILSPDRPYLQAHQRALYVPSIAYERELIISAHKYLAALSSLDAPPPWRVCVSLLNVRGYIMYVDPLSADPRRFQPLSKDEILAEPVTVSSQQQYASANDMAGSLRSAFDEVWRAFGYPRSLNFDDSGQWRGGY